MHTREGGGVDSQKVENLLRNWSFQPPLRSRNEGKEEDTRLMRLEDITAEELEAEFELFQLELSDARFTSKSGRFPERPPPPQCKTPRGVRD
jgi:hypothetical protein